MESYILLVSVLCLLVVQVNCRCYKLEESQNQYLVYESTGIDFTESSNFQLSFKTTKENGLLYYSESEYRDDDAPLDYEGLYLYEGILHYFIFNPTIYGGGFSRGAHVKTDYEVNNGTWITVEFFRNKEGQVPGPFSDSNPVTVEQTGIIVNGDKFVFDGTIDKMDVTDQKLYIGGHVDLAVRIDKQGKLGSFDGYIDMFKDLKSNTELDPIEPGQLFESKECDRNSPLPYA